MIELDKVTIEDKGSLFGLHKRALRPYVEQVYGWDENIQIEYFNKEFCEENCYWIIKDDIRVGAIRYKENENEIFITIIEIDPQYQSKGIGSAVIEMIYDDCVKKNKDLALQVFKINKRAKAFYDRLGFVQIGETDKHYEMKKPHN